MANRRTIGVSLSRLLAGSILLDESREKRKLGRTSPRDLNRVLRPKHSDRPEISVTFEIILLFQVR